MQLVCAKRNADEHAGVVICDDGREERGLLQAGDDPHLREVLVLLGQAVEARGIERGVAHFALILRDHLLAAAAVASQREAAQHGVGRNDARVDQRPRDGDEARRVAAGVGDALARDDGLAHRRGELREAVGPALGRAMRGGGVDDARMVVLYEAHGLARRCVWQAEERDVRGVDQPGALRGVLAQRGVDGQQLDVRPPAEALKDAQAGRALAAVDVNLWFHAACSLPALSARRPSASRTSCRYRGR